MPRTKQVEPASNEAAEATEAFNALTAAGRRLPTNVDKTKIARSGRGWQDQAWGFYDTIGEYRYGCDWVGAIISKATLFLARGGMPVTNGAGIDYVFSLFGGPEAQGQMLREIGIHLTVTGESYIVGTTTKGGAEEWRVVAATELTSRGGKFYISGKEVESKTDPYLLRLWRPHPRRFNEANSPSRAILAILAELDALTKRIFAEIDSRLAGAGILLVPSEMSMPSPGVDAAGDPSITSASTFQAALAEAMMTAITDREAASAMVPIVVTAPGQYIGQAQHLTFWSPLDDKTIELRTEAVRRLALGMDMPPEILTGSGDLNHWTAWALEEGAIKAHAEPLLALICESLTEGYLRPLLIDGGMDPADAEQYTIGADTSQLRLRPNRSKEAFELYDRQQLSGVALRRETGFNEGDAPELAELRDQFIRKVASGSTTPELVAAALAALGVPLGTAEAIAATTTEARPTPSLADHPEQGPPPPPPAASSSPGDGLLAAAEVTVYRALERAGNRLRTKIGRKLPNVSAADTYLHVPVPPGMLDDLLIDAFDGVERYVGCRDVDPDRLVTCLDTYTRSLLVQSRPHDPQLLATYLALTTAAVA
jgi:hypothetical protein